MPDAVIATCCDESMVTVRGGARAQNSYFEFQRAVSSMSDPIELRFTLTQADWRAYMTVWAQRLRGRSGSRWTHALLALGMGAVIAVLVSLLSLSASSMVVGAAVMLSVLHWQSQRLQHLALPEPDGYVLSACTAIFDTIGVQIHKQQSNALYQWASIREIVATPEQLLLWLDRGTAIIVPLRSLPAEMPLDELQAQLRQWRVDAPTVEGVAAVSPERRVRRPQLTLVRADVLR